MSRTEPVRAANRNSTIPTPLARAARAAGLVYSTDDRPGITRRGPPGRFSYTGPRGRAIRDPVLLTRIRKLAIPPAWTDVWINPNSRGHVQASGRDARGRKQYRYHPDWQSSRDATKFEQLLDFARALPQLRHAVAANLRRAPFDRERVAAVVVRLLECSFIRVGNDEYARANRSYGLTTLRDRHARVSRRKIRFAFSGKSGIRHEIELNDPTLAPLVGELQDLPGQVLFQYIDETGRRRRLRSDDVNAFIREHSGGDFTAKHFRTWAGTVLLAIELSRVPPPRKAREVKRTINEALAAVAQRLGNTPAITRKSYVHPLLIDCFTRGQIPAIAHPCTWPSRRARIQLAPEEKAVVRFLRQAARAAAAQARVSPELLRPKPSRRRPKA